MHHCTTLALLLSLSACEHAGPAAQPTTPTPKPPPPTTGVAPVPTEPPLPPDSPPVEKSAPRPTCRARVCAEWKPAPAVVAEPTPPLPEPIAPPALDAGRGVSRAYRPWRGETQKIRVQPATPAPTTTVPLEPGT